MSTEARRPRKGRGPMNPDTVISKALSYTLRHGAQKEGVKMGDDGYVNVGELLSNSRYKSLKVDFPTLQRVVANCEKQRFTLAPITASTINTATSSAEDNADIADTSATVASDSDPTHWRIRANQGHSIPLASLALTPLPAPGLLVHGTFYGAYEPILASGGLKRMARQHVHFAPLEKWEKGEAKSGMRKDAEVMVVVDGDKAVNEGGLKFWESENGVVLTEGDGEGVVGLKWVQRIVEKKTGDVLWSDGERRKELSEELKNKGLPRGKEHVGKGGRGRRRVGKRGGQKGEKGEKGNEVVVNPGES